MREKLAMRVIPPCSAERGGCSATHTVWQARDHEGVAAAAVGHRRAERARSGALIGGSRRTLAERGEGARGGGGEGL